MSTYRGHHIEYDEIKNNWLYSDSKFRVSKDKNRACGCCGLRNTTDGHDGCFGHLADVKNACCGHGKIDDMYIQFENGLRIDGDKARLYHTNKKESK